MHKQCLNCSFKLESSYKFCPACGQKTDTHRLSWHYYAGHASLDYLSYTDFCDLPMFMAKSLGLPVYRFIRSAEIRVFPQDQAVITSTIVHLPVGDKAVISVNGIRHSWCEPDEVEEKIAKIRMYIQLFAGLAIATRETEGVPLYRVAVIVRSYASSSVNMTPDMAAQAMRASDPKMIPIILELIKTLTV